MDRWVVPLTNVTSTGNVTQCYPSWAPVGQVPATATTGQLIRKPCEGQLESLQVMTDGTNAVVLELYDISGADLGADVSSLTVITNAQLVAALAAGTARLIFQQNIAGSGLTPIAALGPAGFVKGLAARAVSSTGTCSLNMAVHGGFRLLERGPAL